MSLAAHHGLLLSGGAVSPPVTWNPADKHSDIALSFANKVATRNASGDDMVAVRATLSRSAGKWYFEILGNFAGFPIPRNLAAGIATSAMSLSEYPGDDASSYSYYSLNGNKLNAAAGTAFGATWGNGAVVGVAYDADAGHVWFAKDNVWQGGGNPAAGTSPAFTGVPTGQFPAVGIYEGSSRILATLRAVAGDQSYAPPAGFSPWES